MLKTLSQSSTFLNAYSSNTENKAIYCTLPIVHIIFLRRGGGLVFIYSKKQTLIKIYISKLNQYDVISQRLEVKEHPILHLFH